MEWMSGDEWIQGVRDPHEMGTPLDDVILPMANRYDRCGTLSVGGYWSEPPKALRAVQYYLAAVNASRRRLTERMNPNE